MATRRTASRAERLRTLGENSAALVHDLNNLLTAILHGCESAAQRLAPHDPVRDDINAIEATAERGRALVADTLRAVRGEAAAPFSIPLDKTLVALGPALNRLTGERVSVVMVPQCPGVRVCIERSALERVIFNLAANARDAMPRGGRLAIRTMPQTDARTDGAAGSAAAGARAGARAGGVPASARPAAVIEVRDTGTGIDAAVRQRMFLPFATGRGRAGTGLGLATVRRAIADAGGTVTVDSAPGRGTAFVLVLPTCEESPDGRDGALDAARDGTPDDPGEGPGCARDGSARDDAPAGAPARAPAHASTGAAGAAPARILLVEDETAVRAFAARALRARGHAVIETDSAEQALDALAGAAPDGAGSADGAVDILVTDVNLPGLDGAALARTMREARPALPVVLVSGYGERAEIAREAAGEGASVLLKPYTLAALIETVHRALDRGAADPAR